MAGDRRRREHLPRGEIEQRRASGRERVERGHLLAGHDGAALRPDEAGERVPGFGLCAAARKRPAHRVRRRAEHERNAALGTRSQRLRVRREAGQRARARGPRKRARASDAAGTSAGEPEAREQDGPARHVDETAERLVDEVVEPFAIGAKSARQARPSRPSNVSPVSSNDRDRERGGAVVERVRDGDRRRDPGQPVRGERQAAQEWRGRRERVDRGAVIVPEAGGG